MQQPKCCELYPYLVHSIPAMAVTIGPKGPGPIELSNIAVKCWTYRHPHFRQNCSNKWQSGKQKI